MTQMVRIRLFAHFRDVFNAEVLEISIPFDATVKVLRDRLAARNPEIASLLAVSQIAVDGEFAGDDAAIRDGAEVAIIPPVSGG